MCAVKFGQQTWDKDVGIYTDTSYSEALAAITVDMTRLTIILFAMGLQFLIQPVRESRKLRSAKHLR